METYMKQGGMNKRQAGEDFYFLQKIIALGHFTEINTTQTIPSARVSSRVPFGTGASMTRWKADGVMKTYSISSFEDIKALIMLVDSLFGADVTYVSSMIDTLSPALREFLYMHNVEDELKSIRTNSASLTTFKQRFFRWFNAFRVIKYLNFAHNKHYEKADVATVALSLASKLGLTEIEHEPGKLLECYRRLDKSGFGITCQ